MCAKFTTMHLDISYRERAGVKGRVGQRQVIKEMQQDV